MQERLEHFLRQKLKNRRERLAKQAAQLREQQGDDASEMRGGDSGEDGGGKGGEGPASVQMVVGSWMDKDMIKGFVTT